MRRRPSFWRVTTYNGVTETIAFEGRALDMRDLLEEFYSTITGEGKAVRYQDLTNQILSGTNFEACNDGAAWYEGSDLYRGYYPWAGRYDGVEDDHIHCRGVYVP